MGRHKRKRIQEDVELNLAAMLDMAFQLLTFFILTFKPAPIEGQVALRLPPPQAIMGKVTPPNAKKAGEDPNDQSPVQGVSSLIITTFSTPAGKLHSLAVGRGGEGDATVGTVQQLNNKLKEIFSDPGNAFEQVIIQVSGDLHYEELMRVVEVCTHQTLPDGKKLSKLSFVPMPGASDAPGGGG
jgi:biopolymer transport protein ExbD